MDCVVPGCSSRTKYGVGNEHRGKADRSIRVHKDWHWGFHCALAGQLAAKPLGSWASVLLLGLMG